MQHGGTGSQEWGAVGWLCLRSYFLGEHGIGLQRATDIPCHLNLHGVSSTDTLKEKQKVHRQASVKKH